MESYSSDENDSVVQRLAEDIRLKLSDSEVITDKSLNFKVPGKCM